MPQSVFTILHKGDAVCKQAKFVFLGLYAAARSEKGACPFSVFMFSSETSETCMFENVWQICPDVLKKESSCQDKKRKRWEKERKRRGGGMKDVISQDRSDLTSLRISMWGLDWTYTCWSAADFSGWKKRYNSVSRELGRESTPPPLPPSFFQEAVIIPMTSAPLIITQELEF